MLLLVQLTPILIILFFAFRFSGSTANPGWILEENTGCKFYTNANHENRSFIWSGNCLEGFADGKGELILLQNGYQFYFFEGYVSKGKVEGFGKSRRLDGDTYEGNYEDGLANGFGRFYNDDGDYYEGNFIDGLRSGSGTYWYKPESQFLKYVGEWKDNKENGAGTLFYRSGKEVSGTFKNGILAESSQ